MWFGGSSSAAAAPPAQSQLAPSESFVARDEKLARSLAEQEDAELARRMAMADAASAWQPAQPVRPRAPHQQGARCPKGHDLKAFTPASTVHTCDQCGRHPIRAPQSVHRCDLCDYDKCTECAQVRPGKGKWLAPPALGGPGGQDSGHDREGMLYVACEVGDIAVEMMVDTGAQMSVISLPLARRLNLMAHLDASVQGVAAGVGQARILGKLRGVQVKLGHVEFYLDFSVLEMRDPLFMLGLDQMRRFKCIVDLERKCLIFGGSGGIDVPFLQQPPENPLAQMRCPTM